MNGGQREKREEPEDSLGPCIDQLFAQSLQDAQDSGAITSLRRIMRKTQPPLR
jgi:hypothetical protein